MNKKNNEWWRNAVFYQIYPRSFMDSNSDGIGDLKGVYSRIDYIESLGVDAVWFSPIFSSPMRDFGYDVSDYTSIDPVFGSIEDFDEVLQELHRRGIKCILDFVPNHTSDLHKWFLESRRSKNSSKRDWYVWRDPLPDGGVPNNWLGAHGGKAWTFDESTGQYYLHSFLPEMPDLNWENAEVREAVYEAMRFWLKRGVDGFRVDVILRLAKDLQFRDEPANPDYTAEQPEYDSLLHVYTRDVDHVHKYIREMRKVMDEFPGSVFIGETYLPVDKLMSYYGDGNEVHFPFNFGLITVEPKASNILDYIKEYSAALPLDACPNWVAGNHDNGRIADVERAGKERAAAFAFLLLLLPGAITIYYGDEIAMINGVFRKEELLDQSAINTDGKMLTRDRARTPMQWSSEEYAGFSNKKPWLPLSPDYKTNNVAQQEKDPQSILSLYRKLIDFRKTHKELFLKPVELIPSPEGVAAFKTGAAKKFLVVLIDIDGTDQKVSISKTLLDCGIPVAGKTVRIASDPALEGLPPPEFLPGFGAVVL